MPRYPVYVISKGRADCCLTARFLLEDKVPFSLVIEPQERNLYAAKFPSVPLLVLPFSNLGLGSIPARNWVWEHARIAGAERHWIIDDNIRYFERVIKGKRIRCNSSFALAVAEDFTDRYDNLAITGFNYHMFVASIQTAPRPFVRNVHVYSCLLIQNSLPYRWRGRYNEDTDLCLRVLTAGLCTVLINAFVILKSPTMKMKGGNTTELYQGDGRLKMARALERMWPGLVTTKRRFKRPQHVVKDSWACFDTPLQLKPGINLDNLPRNDYGMQLHQVKSVRSPELRQLLADQNSKVEKGG